MSGGIGLCSSHRSRWISIHSSTNGSCDKLIWRFSRTESARCSASSSELIPSVISVKDQARRQEQRALAGRHRLAADLLREHRAAQADREAVLDPVARTEVEVVLAHVLVGLAGVDHRVREADA